MYLHRCCVELLPSSLLLVVLILRLVTSHFLFFMSTTARLRRLDTASENIEKDLKFRVVYISPKLGTVFASSRSVAVQPTSPRIVNTYEAVSENTHSVVCASPPALLNDARLPFICFESHVFSIF